MKRKLALLYNNNTNNSRRLLKFLRFTYYTYTTSRMTTKSSPSNANDDDPQCNLVVGNVGLDSLSLNQQQQSKETSSQSSTSQLESLSDDLLLNVLLYCGPTEVEENIKLVSRRLHNATSLSTLLWEEFCILTGKTLDAQFATDNELASSVCVVESQGVVFAKEKEKQYDDDAVDSSSLQSSSSAALAADNLYRLFYFHNPCVPLDFDTINEALKHCPRTKLSTKATTLQSSSTTHDSIIFSETGTVVLMPGVYDERVDISGELWSVGQATFDKSIAIRASFPLIGATIRSPTLPVDDDTLDQPCISISTRDDDETVGVQKGISARLSHLRILHSTPGANIWGGNTAINIEGPRARVIIDSCVLQSDSGRGLVVTTQAVCELYQTSIINCAATGFYLGDWGSRARILGCNIVRNGFGSKRQPTSSSTDDQADDQRPIVPSGHSGVYIESSMCWVDDSLLAGNCLTGLSVVRGGFISLSGSDITENGQQVAAPPILIEDAHDVRATNNRMQQGGPASIRGGVVEGPVKNNYTSRQLEVDEEHLVNGGLLRGGGTSSSWTRQSLT